jgi:hypothetical protein
MQKNESALDRSVRAVLGLAVLYFSFASLAGVWSFIGYLIGIILIVTAITGYCYLYKIFGIKTGG